MRFAVRVHTERLPVEFEFGSQADIGMLRSWNRVASPRVHESMADAIEYARYAAA